MERIPLSTPTLNGKEIDFVQDAFDTNWIAPLGPHVDAFEKEIAEYVGSNYAVALSAGTAAIHLALKLAGVKDGDTVFCQDMTFSASCNPIRYERAIPVLIDSEYDSWNMDPEALEQAFKKHPNAKAVISVNLYGTPANYEKICDICKRHNVPLIEDAAESLGSTYKGTQTGLFGDYGILSFNGNKIITTSGGGMLLAPDKFSADKARFWATQARDEARHYQHSELGYNYRMSNVSAAIGRGQMLTLQDRIDKKTEIYNNYKEGFSGNQYISMNPTLAESKCNYWLSCIVLTENCPVSNLDIMKSLEEKNIETRPIWKPMSLQPYYEKYDFVTKNPKKPVGHDIFSRGLCLPSDPKMTNEQQQIVIEEVLSLFK